MVTTGDNIPEYIENYDYYKKTDKKKSMMMGLRDFHNLLVKRVLIWSVTKPGNTLIDITCGRC